MEQKVELFNKNNRGKNILKASISGLLCQLFNVLVSFVSRTVFLRILSTEYLGLSGLFSNILQILNLAELGITTVIAYRFYEPISKNDYVYVGKLMNFFQKTYRGIAAIITLFGLALLPFIKMLINEESQIPADINVYLIYILYLLNAVVSYFFVYKQTLLSADQRNDIVVVFQTLCKILTTIAQIIVLICTKKYLLYLVIGIVSTIIINYSFSVWITKK